MVVSKSRSQACLFKKGCRDSLMRMDLCWSRLLKFALTQTYLLAREALLALSDWYLVSLVLAVLNFILHWTLTLDFLLTRVVFLTFWGVDVQGRSQDHHHNNRGRCSLWLPLLPPLAGCSPCSPAGCKSAAYVFLQSIPQNGFPWVNPPGLIWIIWNHARNTCKLQCWSLGHSWSFPD